MRFFVLLMACWGSLALAGVYKSYDKDGNVVYSDSPKGKNATEVILPRINTVPSNTQDTPVSSHSLAQADEDMTEGDYQIRITSPRPEASIPAAQQDIAVVVEIEPSLSDTHSLLYTLNGDIVQETQLSNILISHPPRGSLILGVEVIDEDGNVITRADPVTVHLLRFPSPITRGLNNPTPTPKPSPAN